MHLCLGLSSIFFPAGFPRAASETFVSPVRATCFASPYYCFSPLTLKFILAYVCFKYRNYFGSSLLFIANLVGSRISRDSVRGGRAHGSSNSV